MNKFAVLWDMDGVLADSTRLHRFQVGQTAQPLTVDYPVHQFVMLGQMTVKRRYAILTHGDSSFLGFAQV